MSLIWTNPLLALGLQEWDTCRTEYKEDIYHQLEPTQQFYVPVHTVPCSLSVSCRCFGNRTAQIKEQSTQSSGTALFALADANPGNITVSKTLYTFIFKGNMKYAYASGASQEKGLGPIRFGAKAWSS